MSGHAAELARVLTGWAAQLDQRIGARSVYRGHELDHVDVLERVTSNNNIAWRQKKAFADGLAKHELTVGEQRIHAVPANPNAEASANSQTRNLAKQAERKQQS